MKELKSIIQKEVDERISKTINTGIDGIDGNSILMTSVNRTKEEGTISFKDFENTFNSNFNLYFSLDETKDILTCEKEGWYRIELLEKIIHKDATKYSDTNLAAIVNGQRIAIAYASVEKNRYIIFRC